LRTLDYYEILQISSKAEPEVVQAAYRRLARKYHPDSSVEPIPDEKMKLLNEAYSVLSDPVGRQAYDQTRIRSENAADGMDADRVIREKKLVLASDFRSASSSWGELSTREYRAFRRDGGYYISVLRPDYSRYQYPMLNVADFEVQVDVQFAASSGQTARCGLVFHLGQDTLGEDQYYLFSIDQQGHYGLHLLWQGRWDCLVDYRFSRFLRQESHTNSLAVRMARHAISISANQKLLATISDETLSEGAAGLFVLTGKRDWFAEVAFSRFCLYSIL